MVTPAIGQASPVTRRDSHDVVPGSAWQVTTGYERVLQVYRGKCVTVDCAVATGSPSHFPRSGEHQACGPSQTEANPDDRGRASFFRKKEGRKRREYVTLESGICIDAKCIAHCFRDRLNVRLECPIETSWYWEG